MKSWQQWLMQPHVSYKPQQLAIQFEQKQKYKTRASQPHRAMSRLSVVAPTRVLVAASPTWHTAPTAPVHAICTHTRMRPHTSVRLGSCTNKGMAGNA